MLRTRDGRAACPVAARAACGGLAAVLLVVIRLDAVSALGAAPAARPAFAHEAVVASIRRVRDHGGHGAHGHGHGEEAGEEEGPEHETEDVPALIVRLKAVDAALHVAEHEQLALNAERDRLLGLLDDSGTDASDVPTFGDDVLKPGTGAGSWAARAPRYECRTGADRPFGAPARACTRAPVPFNAPTGLPRVYVYELPSRFNKDHSRKYKRCATDQYGTEVFFHEALLASPLRTRDPMEADFFFVPIYGECYLWQHEMLRHIGRVESYAATNSFFNEAMDLVINQNKYWNRTQGRDHVFVFPGARGPTIYSDWQKVIKRSIYLTPEGDRKAFYFNTWKDVVIPGLEADERLWGERYRERLVNPATAPHRRFLAYFRGTIDHREGWAYSKGLRPRLKKLFRNETDIIYDTKKKDCDRSCYIEEMAESKFCLNPLGWTPWTLRFYQAVMTRCIPVIIADDIEFPYESEVDYSQFALKLPEKDVDGIVALLRGISEEELERRRRAMDEVWKLFTYQRPPQEGDAFYATMRELARKRRAFKSSPTRTWD